MELLPVREFADRGTKWLLESPENVSGLLQILDFNLSTKIDFSRLNDEKKSFILDNLRPEFWRIRLQSDLDDAIETMAYEGKVDKFVKVVEEFLKNVLSNRDFRGFREGHLKIHILTLLYLNGLYYIQSELEAERRYVDIFLRETPQFPVDYEWVLELKYIRKG